jgi:hypothetical protein
VLFTLHGTLNFLRVPLQQGTLLGIGDRLLSSIRRNVDSRRSMLLDHIGANFFAVDIMPQM